ncbi:16341_t:CDS:2, partial [Cetraspora pellucida]
FLESVHELVDLPQKVMNSPPNSFQELIDSPQETLYDETCDEMRDEMRNEMCDETYNGTYDGVHDETHDEVHETHKGQDLVRINGALSHINKAICEFSRTYQPKKTNNLQNQHNKGSKKLNCDWKANLSFATGVVQITSFNDNHVEHQLSPDTKIFAPSLSESVFEARFTNLLNNYPAASSYLQKLFLSKESWACAYTFKIFTGGMQSTQRVEGLNNHIKTAINSSSTLLQVMEAIHQCIERESLSQRFNSWSQDRINYNDNLVLQTVFPQVVQQINKYLISNLATKQQKQISWNSDLLNLQDVTYDDDFIENTYDVSQSYLLALIKENEYSSVKEVWRITCLISTKIDDVQENSFQKSVDKKLQFNKSMSLAKKAITLQNSENDNELDTLLKNYIEKKTLQREKETKEREMRILRENNSSENVLAIETDDNQLISIDNVANPLNHIGKGAPKKNRIKGAQEDHTSKKKLNQVQAQDYVDFVMNLITIRAHVHKKNPI